MKLRFGLIAILAISVLMFTACNRGSGTQQKTAVTDTTDSYAKILSGDLSEFAGIWVNRHTRNQLFSNGVFINSSTRSIDGITTGDFYENNGAYLWGLYDDGRLGYEIGLFPVGVPLMLGQNLIVTDTAKVRILIYQFDGPISNDDVFYMEGENLNQSDASVPSDIAEKIYKFIEAAEDGDIAAFRSMLPPWEDYSDYSSQLTLLFDFFGDLFLIDADVFHYAISEGTDDLTEIAEKLFRRTIPQKSRNTGLRVMKMESTPFGINVAVINNQNKELEYYFPYSSF